MPGREPPVGELVSIIGTNGQSRWRGKGGVERAVSPGGGHQAPEAIKWKGGGVHMSAVG